ncbi:nuclear transport factor 2 family protein [Deinococcus yunweiensis]|uniref:nuclear transport factor 2 family protein n=1 Tax=Deinococcus yunweiensis TaxID=367282 RepID=UPI00398E87BB
MSEYRSVATGLAWHDALNAGDVEGLLSLSDPDIELVGPRGSAFGRNVLRKWQAKAGMTLHAHAVFARADVVVVSEHGVWTQAGEVVGETDVASVFRVYDGKVAFLNRLDSLDAALNLAGLTHQDQIRS